MELNIKKESIVYNKSFQFLTKEKKKFVVSKQLLRSGTSTGAKVSEVNGVISKADFSNKMSIDTKNV